MLPIYLSANREEKQKVIQCLLAAALTLAQYIRSEILFQISEWLSHSQKIYLIAILSANFKFFDHSVLAPIERGELF